MPDLIHFLLIEDDQDDITFLKEALDENGIPYKMETLTRGDLITDYLSNIKRLPDLIVMDLNLPKLHGREVLCKIRKDKKFSNVPVIILTTSSLQEDVNFCMEKGADKFVSKPATPEGFRELAGILLQAASKTRQIS